ETERGFAARFRPEDLRDAPAWNSTHADSCVEIDGACGNRFDSDARRIGAHLHDRSLPAALFDLRDGQIKRLFPVFLHRRHAHAAPAVVCGGTLATRQFRRWLETLDTPKKQRTNSRRNYEASRPVSSASVDQKRV